MSGDSKCKEFRENREDLSAQRWILEEKLQIGESGRFKTLENTDNQEIWAPSLILIK